VGNAKRDIAVLETITADLDRLIQRAEANHMRLLAHLIEIALAEAHEELGVAYRAPSADVSKPTALGDGERCRPKVGAK
jgi:hypothetical protein